MTDRFKVLLGPEDYADHIFDTAGADPDEELDKFRRMVSDEQRDEFEEIVSEKDPYEALLSLRWRVPGELMCSYSSKSYATDILSLAEYADRKGSEEIDFWGTAPEGLCSHCWSNTRETLSKETEREAEGIAEKIGTVGYRLRWKQKGRAREEWYDIVVRPETTMAELDKLVCRFSTLNDFHLRMYGLKDEYLDRALTSFQTTSTRTRRTRRPARQRLQRSPSGRTSGRGIGSVSSTTSARPLLLHRQGSLRT